jgi:hypothetical protein
MAYALRSRRLVTTIQLRPIAMYSGVPGGWGIPNPCAAAMNSPASQKVRPGARVSR